jgi:polysaccharide export outer membrane protein
MQAFTGSTRFSLLRSVVAAALLAALPGCATNKEPPAPKVAATPNYSYIIGPGDQLNIIVWHNLDLSNNVPVRPDGKINVALIDDMQAMGKDPTTLQRDIEKALSKYVRDPIVTVIVTGFIGPYSEQIRVIGEAAHPQALPYKQNMTLLDVMIIVGGITDFADGNNARLVRASDGNRIYNVRLRDLLRRGDISANVDVKPGDVLVIPQSWF